MSRTPNARNLTYLGGYILRKTVYRPPCTEHGVKASSKREGLMGKSGAGPAEPLHLTHIDNDKSIRYTAHGVR